MDILPRKYTTVIYSEFNRTYIVSEEAVPLFTSIKEKEKPDLCNNRRVELSDYVIESGRLIKSRT